jgi:hypothetical protein
VISAMIYSCFDVDEIWFLLGSVCELVLGL